MCICIVIRIDFFAKLSLNIPKLYHKDILNQVKIKNLNLCYICKETILQKIEEKLISIITLPCAIFIA